MSELLTYRSDLDELLEGIRDAGSRPLSLARTLPPAAYRSPDLYEMEVSQLFRAGWIVAGHVSEVPEAGDYRCVDVIGEQLVLVRDRQGVVHVLSRVCLHRWMEVATGQGKAKAFQCPYHLWTYSLDGRLVGTPEMQKAEDFDRSTCRLPEIRQEIWRGLVFINLDGNAEPLGPQLAPLDQQLDRQPGTDMGNQVVVNEFDWGDVPGGECAWDWKIFVENFMECYHHLGPHRQSLQAISPAQLSWTDTSNDAYSLMHTGVAPARAAEHPDEAMGFALIHIYPLTILGSGNEGTQIHEIHPTGTGRCRVITKTLGLPEEIAKDDWPQKLAERVERSTKINGEDLAVNRGTQKAVVASNAKPGRLSHLEQPLWEFYHYLASQLCA
jgi:phenylpropionate dioxygenase-like ring-hydroxylating dioxygenase large terminal subunit